MRIIAGKYKGHHLTSFNASHIRPTTDRVKETLFNILMGEIEGVRVLDLFSGTGSLGLEAISRGAQHVTFVEAHVQSLKIIRSNIDKLKISSSEYQIIKSDALQFLTKYKGDPFDLVFIDPPFTEKMAHKVMGEVEKSQIFQLSTKIMIESSKQERIDDIYGVLRRYDARLFGDKTLSFFQKSSDI